MDQKRPVYALVLGALRQEFECYTTIGYLCELRNNRVIDGIVMSTWKYGVDRYPELRNRLTELGVVLVESEPLDEDTPYGNLNYLRQSRQLKAALAVLPKDCLILKARTDLSNFDFNRIDRLRSFELCNPIKPYGEFSAGLSHQIYVLCSGVTCPFAFYDVTYLGAYEDIRRICTTDNSMLSVGIDIWPDVWLFAPYFVSRFSIIEDFYLYIDHMSFMKAMMDLKDKEDLILPEALNKFYALYFVILYQCIHIYHEESLPPGDISLVDVFKGLDTPCLRRTALVEIRSNEIIRLIASGGLRITEGYRHLLDEMKCIRTKGYAEKLSITDTDYNELKVWGREHLGMEPTEWLRPYRKVDCSTENDPAPYDFSDAARILFSDYTSNERIIECIREIAYDRDGYYRHLISALPLFEEHNQALYRKALFNAARYADDRVILRIAKLLWEGCLSADEKKEALYPFQRYAREARLYEPLSSDRVEGLYIYCRYEQREPGLNIVCREWYFRLIHRFAPEMMGLKGSEQEISEEDIRALLEYIGGKESDSIERKIIREALKNISR